MSRWRTGSSADYAPLLEQLASLIPYAATKDTGEGEGTEKGIGDPDLRVYSLLRSSTAIDKTLRSGCPAWSQRMVTVDPFHNIDRQCMFEGATIQAEHLYGMDENRALRFELFHFNQSGTHMPLGFVQTSASDFKYAKPAGMLYMVPVNGSTLKQAFVNLDMAKMGLTT